MTSALQIISDQPRKLRNLDHFRAAIETACGSFQVEPLDRKNAGGAVAKQSTGALNIASIHQNSGVVHRSSKHVRQDGLDHYYLIVQERGGTLFEQNGVKTLLNPGDLMLSDASAPVQMRMSNLQTSQTVLHLPREELTRRVGPQLSGGVRIAREDPISVALLSIIQKIVQNAEDTSSEYYEAFMTLLSAQLQTEQFGRNSWHATDQRIVSEALRLMQNNYRDAEYSVSKLADTLGVSLRRVQRAFATFAETPHQRLLSTRLDAARADLTQPGLQNAQTISGVAFAAGFKDLSTFYRQYKTRFSETPTEARRHMQ